MTAAARAVALRRWKDGDGVASIRHMTMQMNEIQGNTPPPWIGRSRWSLFVDCIGGWRQNWDKLRDMACVLGAMLRPSVVRRRLIRLQSLGHCEATPTMSQLLIAARDQLTFNLGADTREFYKAQGIPWGFHNFRRFVAYPTTMMDPVGFFASKESIIQHLLQTFHRHATYDMVLLHGHEGGLEAMAEQLEQLKLGTHLHQRALDALVEDGSYHDRLRRDLPEFMDNPHVEPRDIPENLVPDAHLMLAMDQFKDLRGYTNYASRLAVGPLHVVVALWHVFINETVGELAGFKIGPQSLCLEACEPQLVARHMGISALQDLPVTHHTPPSETGS